MPRENRIATILIAFLFAFCLERVIVHAQPMVIGYERFHSDSPSIEGGRLLFNELGCVNCHNHPTGLPERQGPHLEGLPSRLNQEWVHAFLSNPSNSKPGTTMPEMHLTDAESTAVVHYLASLKPKKKTPKAFKFVNASRGLQLYHKMGCVACHEPNPDFIPKGGQPKSEFLAYPSISLSNLAKKYDIHSLSAYLKKVHDYSPKGRMPQFTLEREDPGDLAAYLLNYTNGDSTDYPKIQSLKTNKLLAKEGKAIVKSKNCAACHDLPKPNYFARKRPTKIRFSEPTASGHPKYNLSDVQQESINLFLSNTTNKAPVRTHLESLNCVACHDHDGIEGPDTTRKAYFTGNPDLGDSGRFPPPLTDAGRKFQPNWLDKAIKGKKPVRPYLNVQMPDFGASLNGLSSRLEFEDRNRKPRTITDFHVEEGRKLLGTQGGLNCITCHGWEDRRSLGIEAINLGNLHERLQVDWLQEYLIDPAAHRPNTLMPSFWPHGIASNREILDGDTTKQIEAIYSFSKYGEGLPDGFPEVNTSDYEIVPVDRPVVQRTFLEGVGTHALLVGFPEKIHYAIDGETGQPAMMWKGSFFDAYRTWFSRFPEFEKPLGQHIVYWPKIDKSDFSSYKGYRLDSNGIPEFVSELFGAEIFERIEPFISDPGINSFKRTIRYTQEEQLKDPRLLHPKSVQVTETNSVHPLTREFIYRW